MTALSFNSIRDQFGTVMIIDAAATKLQVGWVEENAETRWANLETEAGTGFYQALEQLAVNPNQAKAFVFCEGPGSMLGIRTIVAALRTWIALDPRPIFTYRSLELAGARLAQPGATLIADARRQSWHVLALDEHGKPGDIQRLATNELPAGPIYTLSGMRSWTKLPEPPPSEVTYDASALTTDLAGALLLRETTDPDAFQPERPTFAKWTPRVHQAPPSS